MHYSQKLQRLRAQFPQYGITGYLQPVHDGFFSEYPPACDQRVAWMSGFTGSAGHLLILEDQALLFVDGRYTLQAAQQTDPTLFICYNSGILSIESWLARHAPTAIIGYDAALTTRAMLDALSAHASVISVPNLIDPIWVERPARPASVLHDHDIRWAGQSREDKCAHIASILREQGMDALFISDPESISWLLNIRGHDVENTPLPLIRGVLNADGQPLLEITAERLKDLVHPPAQEDPITWTRFAGKKMLYHRARTPLASVQQLEAAGIHLVAGEDPCILAKARKNPEQIDAIRRVHEIDGRAVQRCLAWLEQHPDVESLTEIDVVEQLHAYRAEHPEFLGPSFPTIAGSGPNGAIVHYRAEPGTNRHVRKGELLLLDSGGQYPGGTTDITRTVAIGTPNAEHQERFTRVLQGHIALATAIFPHGTRGSQLDCLARQFLWQEGLDYDHGTGHGVGQYLSVHEGPQRISKRGGDCALEPGMILSNEPGYYQDGAYGIRIENLVVVVEKMDGFLGFETLTRVPLDTRLIRRDLLSSKEQRWLDEYQSWATHAQ